MSFVTDFVVIFEKYYTAGSSFTAVLISLSFLVVLRLVTLNRSVKCFLNSWELKGRAYKTVNNTIETFNFK